MSIIFNGHYRMEYRTWITALRLHFEEHLPRIVWTSPGRTKINSLWYVRALPQSWPFMASARGMSERELDARLYGSASQYLSYLLKTPLCPKSRW